VKETAASFRLIFDAEPGAKTKPARLLVKIEDGLLGEVKEVSAEGKLSNIPESDLRATMNAFKAEPGKAYQVGVSGVRVATGSKLRIVTQALDAKDLRLNEQELVLEIPIAAATS
jgi:hypothetical protein